MHRPFLHLPAVQADIAHSHPAGKKHTGAIPGRVAGTQDCSRPGHTPHRRAYACPYPAKGMWRKARQAHGWLVFSGNQPETILLHAIISQYPFPHRQMVSPDAWMFYPRDPRWRGCWHEYRGRWRPMRLSGVIGSVLNHRHPYGHGCQQVIKAIRSWKR